MGVTRQEVSIFVETLLSQLASDWDQDGEITPETLLFRGLGFQSLDAVVLGSSIQEHYGVTIPYANLLADIGQRELRDVSVQEWVDFTFHALSGRTVGGS